MKCIYVLSVVLAVAAASRYETKYDDFNLEAVVEDVSALRKFHECFVDVGPCDDVSATYKNDLPHLIENACAECNDKQKHHMKVFADGMKAKLPAEFAVFRKKFDPEDIYFAKLAPVIENY